MPPTPVEVPNNCKIEVRFRQRIYAQEVMNVMHYIYEGEPSPLTLVNDALIDGLMGDAGDLVGQINEAQSEFLDFYAIDVQPIHPVRYSFIRNTGPGLGKVVAADPNDRPYVNVAAAITKLCAATGPGLHGTFHLAGIPQNSNTGGIWSDAFKTKLELIAGGLTQVIPVPGADSDLWPIIYSRTAPLVFQYVTGTIVQDTTRVMRRRTVGLGI